MKLYWRTTDGKLSPLSYKVAKDKLKVYVTPSANVPKNDYHHIAAAIGRIIKGADIVLT